MFTTWISCSLLFNFLRDVIQFRDKSRITRTNSEGPVANGESLEDNNDNRLDKWSATFESKGLKSSRSETEYIGL